jgi:hypothetical protein
MKLKKYYTIDECNDYEKFFLELDSLVSEGKISYEEVDFQIFQINDLDLTTKDIKTLVKTFENLEVYDTEFGIESDDDSDEEDDFFLSL